MLLLIACFKLNLTSYFSLSRILITSIKCELRTCFKNGRIILFPKSVRHFSGRTCEEPMENENTNTIITMLMIWKIPNTIIIVTSTKHCPRNLRKTTFAFTCSNGMKFDLLKIESRVRQLHVMLRVVRAAKVRYVK